MPTQPHSQTTRHGRPLKQRLFTAPALPRIAIGSGFCAALLVEPGRAGWVQLQVCADEAALERVRIESVDGLLHIDLAPGSPLDLVTLSLTARLGPLHQVVASGAADVVVRGLQDRSVMLASRGASRIRACGSAAEWRLQTAGTGRTQLHMTSPAEAVRLDANEASRQWIEGAVQRLCLRARGTARVHAEQLRAGRVQVGLSGIASAAVHAHELVEGEVRGRAGLRVAGPARVVASGRHRKS